MLLSYTPALGTLWKKVCTCIVTDVCTSAFVELCGFFSYCYNQFFPYSEFYEWYSCFKFKSLCSSFSIFLMKRVSGGLWLPPLWHHSVLIARVLNEWRLERPGFLFPVLSLFIMGIKPSIPNSIENPDVLIHNTLTLKGLRGSFWPPPPSGFFWITQKRVRFFNEILAIPSL